MQTEQCFSGLMQSARAILYHKQSTSAMTRFFRLQDAGVCIGGAYASGGTPASPGVIAHPGAVAAEVERWLGLQSGGLSVEAQYQECVDVDGADVPVYLLRFTSIDPPFGAAEAVGGSFITLTQARGLDASELELLRAAYTMIMEG